MASSFSRAALAATLAALALPSAAAAAAVPVNVNFDPAGEDGSTLAINGSALGSADVSISSFADAPNTITITRGDGALTVSGDPACTQTVPGDEVTCLINDGTLQSLSVDLRGLDTESYVFLNDLKPAVASVGPYAITLIGAGSQTVNAETFPNGLVVNTGDGVDRIYGGGGGDSLSGGDGNDLIFGNAGGDALYGGAGDDHLEGGDGADIFRPGDGDDSSSGDAGDDGFDGSVGDDENYGGAGNDTFSAGDDTGADHYVGNENDAVTLEGGGDTVNYFGRTLPVTIDLPDADRASFDNGEADEGDSLMDIEIANGGDGNDWLVGNAGVNMLDAGAGDDVVIGGHGADYLYGGPGIDRIDARVYDGTPDVDAEISCSSTSASGERGIVALDRTDATPTNCTDRAPGLIGELTLVGEAKIGATLTTSGLTAFDNDAAAGAVVAPKTQWLACSNDGCEGVGEGASYTVRAADAGRYIHAEVTIQRNDFADFWAGDSRSAGFSAPVPAGVVTPPATTPPVVIPPPAPTFQQATADSAAQQLGTGALLLKLPQLKHGEVVFQAKAVRKQKLTFNTKKATPLFGIACVTACKVTATQTVLLPASSKKSKAKRLTLKAKKLTTSGRAVSPIAFAPSKAQSTLIAKNKKAKLTVVLSIAAGSNKATKVTKTFTLAAAKAPKKTKTGGK